MSLGRRRGDRRRAGRSPGGCGCDEDSDAHALSTPQRVAGGAAPSKAGSITALTRRQVVGFDCHLCDTRAVEEASDCIEADTVAAITLVSAAPARRSLRPLPPSASLHARLGGGFGVDLLQCLSRRAPRILVLILEQFQQGRNCPLGLRTKSFERTSRSTSH